jgi:hypothetical protein
MGDRSSDASELLGLDGFVVLSQTEEDGELWILVETTADVAGCPRCGVRATGHGRSVVEVRDLPFGGRSVRLVWRKRRWLCTDSDCDAKSFTERTPEIEGCLTRRAAKETCRRVGEHVQDTPRARVGPQGPDLAVVGQLLLPGDADPPYLADEFLLRASEWISCRRSPRRPIARSRSVRQQLRQPASPPGAAVGCAGEHPVGAREGSSLPCTPEMCVTTTHFFEIGTLVAESLGVGSRISRIPSLYAALMSVSFTPPGSGSERENDP